MKNKTCVLTLTGLLFCMFQLNAMKRDDSREFIDRRPLKKAQPELKEKTDKLAKKLESFSSQPTMKSLPTPSAQAFKATQETEQAQRAHEASIEEYSEFYNEFYRQYRQARQEDEYLPNRFFNELWFCKNTMPSHLNKHARAFNRLLSLAQAFRAPAPEVAPDPDVDGEDLPLTVPLDESNLNAD